MTLSYFANATSASADVLPPLILAGKLAVTRGPSAPSGTMTRDLSPREEEIVQLCVDGLTNESIAQRLGISVGTVNTYWVRIKLKVGGAGRTDTVVKVVRERSEQALRDSNTERSMMRELLAEREHIVLEHRAALAMLQLAMDQIKSTVWAINGDLAIQIIANGEFPSTHNGVKWEVGKTVYEIFKTRDPLNPAIAAHLAAIAGEESGLRLTGDFSHMFLRCVPLLDEEEEVIGCISILNVIEHSDFSARPPH